MWKAILVLFMTSNTQPVSTMVGEFPQGFANKADCQAFVAKTRDDIDGTIKVFAKYAEQGFEVLKHDLHCLEDTGGELV